MSSLHPADTIAAIATPAGTGAIALLRISGPAALTIAKTVFSPTNPNSTLKPRRATFGRILAADSTLIDEVLLTHFPAPARDPGED